MLPIRQGTDIPHPPVPIPAVQNPPLRDPSADRALVYAVYAGDETGFEQRLNEALAAGASLDATDDQGCGLLEIAVRVNSVAMAQILVAKKNMLPFVRDDGFDVLMQAASNGNAEMIALLVDRGGMSVQTDDATGQTALHHAVKSGSADAVAALIARGADCNWAAFDIEAQELNGIFGPHHHQDDEAITPLAIAVATRNLPIVKLLLEHGAILHSGLHNPLWLAVRTQDAAIFGELLVHCARKQQGAMLNEPLLYSLLTINDQTALLRLFLEQQRYGNARPPNLEAALLTAISLGHVEQAAVLIDEGALPDSLTDPDAPVWTAAAMQQDSTMIELLTASRPTAFIELLAPQSGGRPSLLVYLCSLVKDPRELAIHGIFRASIHTILPQLNELAAARGSLTPAQVAVATAHLLFDGGVEPSARERVADREQRPGGAQALHAPAQQGQPPNQPIHQEKIRTAMLTRRQSIEHIAQSAVNLLKRALADALSPRALQRILLSRQNQGTAFAMWQFLRETHGLPDPIANSIADAWEDTEKEIAASASGAVPIDMAARQMANVLFCSLQKLPSENSEVSQFCKTLLIDLLQTPRAPLLALIRQPVSFIRSQIQQNNPPSNNLPTLASSLALATAMPEPVCNALATCWQRANADVNAEPEGDAGADRIRLLEHQFAGYWKAWLVGHADQADTASLPWTAEELRQAIDWCEQALSVPLLSRKRRAEGEASGAPPEKSGRPN